MGRQNIEATLVKKQFSIYKNFTLLMGFHINVLHRAEYILLLLKDQGTWTQLDQDHHPDNHKHHNHQYDYKSNSTNSKSPSTQVVGNHPSSGVSLASIRASPTSAKLFLTQSHSCLQLLKADHRDDIFSKFLTDRSISGGAFIGSHNWNLCFPQPATSSSS